jgi:class 3 adenylate cyclase
MPEATCSNCAAPLPEGARFCMNCGQPVAAAGRVDEEARARLTAAAPAPLREKLRQPRLTGERKPVTALFADVVGSTTLAESMDAEDWTSVMNGAFEAMSGAIHRYEGTIAKLVGDAVLAFFGAPVAHEDDPERAVRAALDILDAVRDYATVMKDDHGIDFAVRIGINSGQVMVGNVGSDLRYEYTALGDAVNVAARMQNAARPGTALITDATYRFVQHAVDATDLGLIDVKGKTDPVRAYEVVGLKAVPTSARGLSTAGLESPMVGRDDDFARLGAALAEARGGATRAAVIVGEPGIGKSRLLAELRAIAAQGRGVSWVEGRCLSFGLALPYHLLVDVTRSVIGVAASAEEDETAAALETRVDALLTDADERIHAKVFLAHLLALPLAPADRAMLDGLDPGAVVAGYLLALSRLLGALAADRPIVLVCEDIHWADTASVDAMVKLFTLIRTLPLLLVLTSRPDRDAQGWRLIESAHEHFGAAATDITLRPLSTEASRELVANLLMIESLPTSVRDFILARTEGNPFFVEEVIRMLIDRGAIVRREERWIATSAVEGVEIPETLQGLLLARIDRLPDDAKRTLRVASVIGRQFSVRVLERVLDETATP